MKKDNNLVQADLLVEFFKKNPNRDIKHPEVVDWVVDTYKKRTGKIFRDPDRAIRKLFQTGFLIKIAKGVYKYDPDKAYKRELEDFTPAIKQAIFKKNNFRCVMCGKGRENGIEIHADHIKPKDFGGKATLENGQTLCSKHNFMKKNLNQTESGKKMFLELYRLAKVSKEESLIKFFTEILEVYEKNNMNGHIEWEK